LALTGEDLGRLHEGGGVDWAGRARIDGGGEDLFELEFGHGVEW
jgi:hypothetical protein